MPIPLDLIKKIGDYRTQGYDDDAIVEGLSASENFPDVAERVNKYRQEGYTSAAIIQGIHEGFQKASLTRPASASLGAKYFEGSAPDPNVLQKEKGTSTISWDNSRPNVDPNAMLPGNPTKPHGLTLAEVKNIPSQVKAGLVTGGLGVVEGMLGAGEALGSDRAGMYADHMEKLKLQVIADYQAQAKEKGIDVEHGTTLGFWGDLAGGFASSAVFFVPAFGLAKVSTAMKVAPTIAKWMGIGTGTLMDAGTEAGNVYRETVKETGDKAKAQEAAAKTFAANIPLNLITYRAGLFAEMGAPANRAAKMALAEGLQETTQSVISQGATTQQTKGAIEIDWEQAAYEGFLGGITGGVMGAGFHSLDNALLRRRLKAAGLSNEQITEVIETKNSGAKEEEIASKAFSVFKENQLNEKMAKENEAEYRKAQKAGKEPVADLVSEMDRQVAATPERNIKEATSTTEMNPPPPQVVEQSTTEGAQQMIEEPDVEAHTVADLQQATAPAPDMSNKLGPDDFINGITRETAGRLIINGDTDHLTAHVKEGVKIHGKDVMSDAIRNEVMNQAGNAVDLPKDVRKKAKKNIKQAEDAVNAVLTPVVESDVHTPVKGETASEPTETSTAHPSRVSDMTKKARRQIEKMYDSGDYTPHQISQKLGMELDQVMGAIAQHENGTGTTIVKKIRPTTNALTEFTEDMELAQNDTFSNFLPKGNMSAQQLRTWSLNNLKNAVDNGQITVQDAAIIEAVLNAMPDAYAERFGVSFSDQAMSPTEDAAKQEGFTSKEIRNKDLQMTAALIPQKIGDLQQDARHIAIMFKSANAIDFIHEFGEFAYDRLTTRKERSTIKALFQKAQKAGLATGATYRNEWFAEQFEKYWFDRAQKEVALFGTQYNGLAKIFRNVLKAIKTTWDRMKGDTSIAPEIRAICDDIITEGRDINAKYYRTDAEMLALYVLGREVTATLFGNELLEGVEESLYAAKNQGLTENGKTFLSFDPSSMCPKLESFIDFLAKKVVEKGYTVQDLIDPRNIALLYNEALNSGIPVPCSYCYVEQARQKALYYHQMGKGIGGVTFAMAKQIYGNVEYTDAILKMPQKMVDEMNKRGGLRLFSFSDYIRSRHQETITRVLQHCQQRGLSVKAITKNPDFVEDFAWTGITINQSIDFLNQGFGMDHQVAAANSMRWPNVHVRSVALNPEQIWDMAAAKLPNGEDFINVMTPYHHDNVEEEVPEGYVDMGYKTAGGKMVREMVASEEGKRLNLATRLCCQANGKCFNEAHKKQCATNCGAIASKLTVPQGDIPAYFSQEQRVKRTLEQAQKDIEAVRAGKSVGSRGDTMTLNFLGLQTLYQDIVRATKWLLKKTQPGGNVTVEPDHTGLRFGATIKTPSRIGGKVGYYVALAKKAIAVQDRLRGTIKDTMDAIYKPLNKEQRQEFEELLWLGDVFGTEYDGNALAQMGFDDTVIAAYKAQRSFHFKTWRLLNAHRKKFGGDTGFIVGHMPHVFRHWNVWCNGDIMATADTLNDAVQKANALPPQFNYEVRPQVFSLPQDYVQRTVLADRNYFAMVNNVENQFNMTLDDAKNLVDLVAQRQNKRRFLGHAFKRKGYGGFDTRNVHKILTNYYNGVARYLALDDFKARAVPQFQKDFGVKYGDARSAKDSPKVDAATARYVEKYIDDVQGIPTHVEMLLNHSLKKAFGSFVKSERPALWAMNNIMHITAVMKLGLLNLSSGVVNLSQNINTFSQVPTKHYAKAMAKTLRPDVATLRLLKRAGIEYQFGLSDTGGYSMTHKAKGLLDATMITFSKPEHWNRSISFLSGYYWAKSRGASEGAAMALGKKITMQTQFDYSVADTGAIFRANPLFRAALQFKPFAVKQVEFMLGVRKQGLVTNSKFWVPYMLMVGALGFPLSKGVAALIEYLTGMNPIKATKKAIMEWAAGDPTKTRIGNTLLYGVMSNAGVDVTQRVGVSDALPDEAKDLLPVIVSTMMQAKDVINKGGDNTELVRAFAPSLGNFATALETAMNQGIVQDPLNRERMKYLATPWQIMLKATGFRPMAESQLATMEELEKYANDKYDKQRRRFIDKSIESLTDGDAEGLVKLLVESMKNGTPVTMKDIKDELVKKSLPADVRSVLDARKTVRQQQMLLKEYYDTSNGMTLTLQPESD